jgi:serine/threonine protein kinase
MSDFCRSAMQRLAPVVPNGLAYRLPEKENFFKHPEPITIDGSAIRTNKGDYISSGGFSLVFNWKTNQVIKITLQPRGFTKLEVDLMEWSSTHGGVQFIQWGKLNIDFQEYTDLVGDRTLPVNWPESSITIDNWETIIDEYSFCYTITERWTDNLFNWLNQSKENKLSSLDAGLVKKLLAQVQQLHKLGVVHLDLFPKNIFYKINELGAISDLTIADFGNANFRNAWLFEENLKKDEKRQNYAKDYFIPSLTNSLGNAFQSKKFEWVPVSEKVSETKILLQCLESEPRNYDLNFFFYYNSTNPNRPLTEYIGAKMKLPTYIDREFNWSLNGTLNCQLKIWPTDQLAANGEQFEVSAFWTLNKLLSKLPWKQITNYNFVLVNATNYTLKETPKTVPGTSSVSKVIKVVGENYFIWIQPKPQ